MKTHVFLVCLLISKVTVGQTGLLAFYPFNGNANDLTGNGNNGIVYGAVLSPDRFGNQGSAYHFNGNTDYIKILPNSMMVDSLNNSQHLTITAWVKSDTLAAGIYAIFNHWYPTPIPGPVGIQFSIRDHRMAAADIHNQYTTSSPTILTSNQWYFVALVYDGTISDPNLRYWWFVNCNKYFSDCSYPGTICPFPSHLGNQANETMIGAASMAGTPHYYFKGSIDEVRCFNSSLSDTQISSICNCSTSSSLSLGSDTSICAGDSLVLTGGNSGLNYIWSYNNTIIPNATTNMYTAHQEGIYSVGVNSGACSGTDTVHVTVKNPPSLFIPSDFTLCEGESLIVDVNDPSFNSFLWSGPDNFFSTSESLAISNISSSQQGIYTLTVSHPCGVFRDTVDIKIIPSLKSLVIQNAFSPNTDNKNDFYTLNSSADFEMKIFNRWGEELKVLNQYENFWDGTYNGNPVPGGIYVYLLKGLDCTGNPVERNGTISIFR